MFAYYGHGRADPLALQSAHEARAAARSAETDVAALEQQVERLYLITEALWTFLRDKLGYSDEDLESMVKQIDLRDGKLDGKVAPPPPKPCPMCQRALSRTKSFCIFCGEPVSQSAFER